MPRRTRVHREEVRKKSAKRREVSVCKRSVFWQPPRRAPVFLGPVRFQPACPVARVSRRAPHALEISGRESTPPSTGRLRHARTCCRPGVNWVGTTVLLLYVLRNTIGKVGRRTATQQLRDIHSDGPLLIPAPTTSTHYSPPLPTHPSTHHHHAHAKKNTPSSILLSIPRPRETILRRAQS